jgi:hypothetical protein
MSVPTSMSPLIPPNPFSALSATATPNQECSGDGHTIIRRAEDTIDPFGQPTIPFGSFFANSLFDARTAIGLYREYGQAPFLPPDLDNGELKVYDLNGDGIIDCATIDFIVTIKYLHWMNVRDLSRCVQDEWKRVYDLTVQHERHHENDVREVWFQAHLRFLNIPINDRATIDRIANDLEQEFNGREAVWDARDNIESSKLRKCCAGASLQNNQCVCIASGATYNEQGGTANNPNGGCECPSDQDLHLGILCVPKCTGGRIHTGLFGFCMCPFGTAMQDGQCRVPLRPLCTSGLKSCVVDGVLQCINVDYDESNCGDCGKTCPADQQCINGQCRIPGQCRFCDANNPCPSGTICAGDKCYPYTWSTPANTLPCGAANSAYYNCPADRPQGLRGPDPSWACRGEGAGKMLNTVCINLSECR